VLGGGGGGVGGGVCGGGGGGKGTPYKPIGGRRIRKSHSPSPESKTPSPLDEKGGKDGVRTYAFYRKGRKGVGKRGRYRSRTKEGEKAVRPYQ